MAYPFWHDFLSNEDRLFPLPWIDICFSLLSYVIINYYFFNVA